MALRWDFLCARCDRPSSRSVCRKCRRALAARVAAPKAGSSQRRGRWTFRRVTAPSFSSDARTAWFPLGGRASEAQIAAKDGPSLSFAALIARDAKWTSTPNGVRALQSLAFGRGRVPLPNAGADPAPTDAPLGQSMRDTSSVARALHPSAWPDPPNERTGG